MRKGATRWVAGLTAIALCLFWPRSGLATNPDVRVGIAVDVPRVTVEATGAFSVRRGQQVLASPPAAGSVQVQRTAAGLSVTLNGAGLGEAAGVVTMVPAAGQHLRVDGILYRGHMEVHPGPAGLLVLVNILPLEQYLYGVVPAEMPASWPMEALKAQAVACRTFALSRLNTPARPGVFDLWSTTTDQVYGGLSRETARTNQAVDETRGQILTHNGNPILASYHSSSGGHTESSHIVWGGNRTYLRGVPDFDEESPHRQWSVTWTPEGLGAQFQQAGHVVGAVTALHPAGTRGVSGRWTHYYVVGQLRTLRFTANQVRTILGLHSTNFEVQVGLSSPGAVTQVLSNHQVAEVLASAGRRASVPLGRFQVVGAQGVSQPANWPTVLAIRPALHAITLVGRGRGHGVGMSQWGARGMALLGHNYRQILAHFYRGAVLTQR